MFNFFLYIHWKFHVIYKCDFFSQIRDRHINIAIYQESRIVYTSTKDNNTDGKAKLL